jgi:hypothetical protein
MSRLPTPSRHIPSLPNSQIPLRIDELEQRNRILEHSNKLLNKSVVEERARSDEAVKAIRTQWQAEKKEWEQSVETLHEFHQIAHLRAKAEIEKERMKGLQEGDQIRQTHVDGIDKEYRLTISQVKISELEFQIAELEEEIEEIKVQAQEHTQSTIDCYQNIIDQLKSKCSEFSEETKAKSRELQDVLKGIAKTEVNLSVCLHVADTYKFKYAGQAISTAV